MMSKSALPCPSAVKLPCPSAMMLCFTKSPETKSQAMMDQGLRDHETKERFPSFDSLMLWLGVTTTWETVLKGHSIRKVEDHGFKLSLSYLQFLTQCKGCKIVVVPYCLGKMTRESLWSHPKHTSFPSNIPDKQLFESWKKNPWL